MPTAKRRTTRRRKRSEARLRGGSLAACLFVSFWGMLILYIYASVGNVKSGSGSGSAARGQKGGLSSSAGAVAAGAAKGGESVVSRVAAASDPADPDSDSVEARLAALEPPTPNPYEGWQPPIDDDSSAASSCTWRECFKKTTRCALCRDLESQLGPSEAPQVPDGWIPDVHLLRRMYLRGTDADGNRWPPPIPESPFCEDIAVNGGPTNDVNRECLDAIPVVGEPLGKSEGRARREGLSNGKAIPRGARMPRLMCLVYTMSSEHATRIRAIRETWAGGCDGFLAFSTQSDPRIPAISLPHDGPEEYSNMWQKIRSIWRFVGTNYLDDFDYFFIGGDDLFVMPQNLREYLWTLGSPEDDHFVGRRFKTHVYFNSGGAGYALSRGTLRKFVEHMEDSKCSPRGHTSMEDVMIARCLDSLGIGLTDTRDDRGRERFHPFAPGTHIHWKAGNDWYDRYNTEWGLKYGKDCCAPDSVSWHYMKKPAMVRHIYSLLYLCGKDDAGETGEGRRGGEQQGGGLEGLRKRKVQR